MGEGRGGGGEPRWKSLRELRVAEVSELDLQIEDGVVHAYRAKVRVSFKYEGDD